MQMPATPDQHPIDPSAIECRCPQCGTELWAERGGVYTLKARILRYQGEAFVAVCPECRGEVAVPWLRVSTDLATHRQAAPRRRLILRALDTAKAPGQR
jgi:hypothetical protein